MHGISKPLDSYLDDYYYCLLYHRYISKSKLPMSEYRRRYHGAGRGYRFEYSVNDKLVGMIGIDVPYQVKVSKIVQDMIIAIDIHDNLWINSINTGLSVKIMSIVNTKVGIFILLMMPN